MFKQMVAIEIITKLSLDYTCQGLFFSRPRCEIAFFTHIFSSLPAKEATRRLVGNLRVLSYCAIIERHDHDLFFLFPTAMLSLLINVLRICAHIQCETTTRRHSIDRQIIHERDREKDVGDVAKHDWKRADTEREGNMKEGRKTEL